MFSSKQKKQVPLVVDLRNRAIGKGDIVELLNFARVAAIKLGLNEFRDWLTLERDGYKEHEVPDYRYVRARLVYQNWVHGRQPVFCQSKSLEALLTNIRIPDSISDLRNTVFDGSGQAHVADFEIPLPSDVQMELMQLMRPQGALVVRLVAASEFSSIFQSVRNRVLDFAVDLEAKGILGENMEFSRGEVETAQQGTVNNFNIRQVNGNVAAGFTNSKNRMTNSVGLAAGDVTALLDFLKSSGVSESDRQELRRAIKQDGQCEGGKMGNQTAKWLSEFMSKVFTGSIELSTGVSANLISAAVQSYFGIGT